MRDITKDDIGKRITFKIETCYWIPRKETRVVNGVTGDGNFISVRCYGCPKFLIHQHEVISIESDN